MKKWEPDNSVEQNNSDWDRLYVEQAGKYDKDGKRKIMIDHPVEIHKKKKGTRQSKGVKQGKGITDEQFQVRSRRIACRWRSSSDSSHDSLPETAEAKHIPDSCSGKSRQPTAPSTMRASATTRAYDDDVVSNHSRRSSVGSKSGKGRARVSSLARPITMGSDALETMSLVNTELKKFFFKAADNFNTCGFVNAKGFLTGKISELLVQLGTKSKGFIGELLREEALLQKRGGTSADLNHKSADLASELQKVVSELVGLSGLLKPATKTGLDAIKDKYYEVVKELEPTWLILDDHLAAVKSRASAALTTYRADYQTAYWKPRKVQEQWVSGGWPKGLAKLCSDKVAQFFYKDGIFADEYYHSGTYCVNPEVDKFSADVITVFAGPAGAAIAKFRGFIHTQLEPLKLKYDSLQATLAEHPRWPGGQGVCSTFEIKEEHCGMLSDLFEGQDVLSTLPGGKPWMRLIYNNRPASGPQDSFMPGTAAFFMALYTPMSLVCCRVEPLLSKGVTLEAYDHFFDTEVGRQHGVKELTIINLNVGDFCYVPEGTNVHISNFEPSNGKKDWMPAMSAIVHCPVF